MTIARDAQYVAELATRIANAVTLVDRHNQTVLDRMRDSMAGHPRAASWDSGPRATLVFCDLHQQDVRMCHRETWGCTGVPLVSRSDPTGDSALEPDIAATDLKNLARALHRMVNDADLIVRIVGDYPEPRAANAYERQQTANENDPRCESCCRVEIAKGIPWWVEPRTKERTTIGGRLEQPMWACDWCENHVIQTGLIPTEDEVEQHRAGKRVRCPHPKVQEGAA